ncbi:hypothetical protein DVH24_021387 [Malus domestica]|uniref:CRM domain-containing protein n=1 Tax=Malus domestica TaxID=3750 RepID=A0A498JWM6_MALDO|nr:hypothetical protein DVH24_021387 [Malus domestica]
MAAAVGVPTCHRLHLLLHLPPPPPPPYSSFSLFLKPLVTSTTTTTIAFTHLHIPRRTLISHSLPSFSSRPLSFCLPPTAPHSPPPPRPLYKKKHKPNNSKFQKIIIMIEIENSDNKEDGQVSSDPTPALKRDGVKPPTLTVKEKKELASYAHSLGKKLKSQLVGKSGLTASVAASFIENLESNELRKVKIHGTCPGELEDVGTQLEESTGSVVTKDIIETHIDGIP